MSNLKREKHILDATGKSLGRLASEVSILLLGKHKPEFDPSKDTGDYVIVKNLEKVKVTGKKLEKKKYYRHSGYLGGLKETTLKRRLEQDPKKLFKEIVAKMLPKNKLRKRILNRLKFE